MARRAGHQFELSSSVSAGFLGAGAVTLGTLLEQLQHTYCGKVGFEFMHLQSRAVVNWFRDRVEHYPMFSYCPSRVDGLRKRPSRLP